MKHSLFDRIFSYLLSVGLAGAILVIGLTFIYSNPHIQSVISGREAVWPAAFELDGDLLTAEAAVVYDPITGKVLYAKNADEVLPLASLTKIIAAKTVLAYEEPEKEVEITAGSLEPEGDWGFWVGEKWSLRDLITFALAASSNDAIFAAAAGAFGADRVAVINSKAQELGLEETEVYNSTGLDVSGDQAGGYGSAREVALLTANFLEEYPTFFEQTAAPTVTISNGVRTLTATSTAGPLLDMPGLIGAKTGFTDLAGGNLVAAFDVELGHPVIIAVLGSTREGRFADVKLLLEEVRKK